MHCTQSTSMGFTSIQGPPDGYQFNGIKSKGMYVFYPPVCEQLCSTGAVSMDETIKLAFQLEHNYIKKPDLFISIFRDKINEFI